MSKYIYRVLNYQQTLSQYFSLNDGIDLTVPKVTGASNFIELCRNINPHLVSGSYIDTEFISFSTELYPILKKFGAYQDYDEYMRNLVIVVDNHNTSEILIEPKEEENFLKEKVSSIKKLVINFNEKNIIDFMNKTGLLRCKNGNDINLSRGFNYANYYNEVISYKKVNKEDIVKKMRSSDIDIFFLLKNILDYVNDDKILEYIRLIEVRPTDDFTREEKEFYNAHYYNNFNFYNIVERDYLANDGNYVDVLHMYMEIKRRVLWKIINYHLPIGCDLDRIVLVEDIAIKESKDLIQLIKERKNIQKKIKRD